MNVTMRLTLDGLARALRGEAHTIAGELSGARTPASLSTMLADSAATPLARGGAPGHGRGGDRSPVSGTARTIRGHVQTRGHAGDVGQS